MPCGQTRTPAAQSDGEQHSNLKSACDGAGYGSAVSVADCGGPRPCGRLSSRLCHHPPPAGYKIVCAVGQGEEVYPGFKLAQAVCRCRAAGHLLMVLSIMVGLVGLVRVLVWAGWALSAWTAAVWGDRERLVSVDCQCSGGAALAANAQEGQH